MDNQTITLISGFGTTSPTSVSVNFERNFVTVYGEYHHCASTKLGVKQPENFTVYDKTCLDLGRMILEHLTKKES